MASGSDATGLEFSSHGDDGNGWNKQWRKMQEERLLKAKAPILVYMLYGTRP